MEAAATLLGPEGSKSSLQEEGKLYLTGESPEGALLGFAVYHYGFEEDQVRMIEDNLHPTSLLSLDL